MLDFFFVIKTLVLTVIILILMQVRWGENTIEQQAMSFVQTSSFVQPIREVAQSAVTLSQRGLKHVAARIKEKNISLWGAEDEARVRGISEKIGRGKDYLEDKALSLRESLSEDEPSVLRKHE